MKQSEPNKRDKGYAWHTAIGLQAVDGLKTSKYLIDTAIKNIEGDISIDEAQLVCERCIFNYGDYGCLPVVTFFAFRTLRSSVAFFHGIALFAFRLSVTLVTFFPPVYLVPQCHQIMIGMNFFYFGF